MDRLEQRQAFGDELSALCIRYIREFDVSVPDLLLVLAAEMRVLIEAEEGMPEEPVETEETNNG